ncbi:hypothetical protein [Gryllotalpicola protaetiae]|nr:hypothetical protein [Gryllotalpicola protaetiae]
MPALTAAPHPLGTLDEQAREAAGQRLITRSTAIRSAMTASC